MRLVSSAIMLVGATLFASACFIDYPDLVDGAPVACEAFTELFCRCPGGQPGTQTCNGNGTELGECLTIGGAACPSVTAPSDDGASNEDPPSKPPKPEGTSSSSSGAGASGGQGAGGSGGGSGGQGGSGGAPPLGCEGYDNLGACEGQTLKWCKDWLDPPEVVTEDCTEKHQACEVDSDGYAFCVNPPECGTITWAGTCDGNTVKYCNDASTPPSVEELECTSPKVCGYDSTYEYYACIDP